MGFLIAIVDDTHSPVWHARNLYCPFIFHDVCFNAFLHDSLDKHDRLNCMAGLGSATHRGAYRTSYQPFAGIALLTRRTTYESMGGNFSCFYTYLDCTFSTSLLCDDVISHLVHYQEIMKSGNQEIWTDKGIYILFNKKCQTCEVLARDLPRTDSQPRGWGEES